MKRKRRRDSAESAAGGSLRGQPASLSGRATHPTALPSFFSFEKKRLAFDAGVTAPDAPDLFFVSGLSVVGEVGGGESAGSPTELSPLFGFPAAENGVEITADETVAAADAVKNADFAGFDDLPFAVDIGDGAPEVGVGIENLTESGGESGGVGISGFDAFAHFLEVFAFFGSCLGKQHDSSDFKCADID